MKKNSKYIALFLFGCFAALLIFTSKLYYPPMPIESISKKELVSLGKEAVDKLVYATSENHYDWYIVSEDSTKATNEIIQQTAAQHGWQFVEQLGSGYIFEKNDEQLIITAKMWSKHFQLVQVPLNTFD